MFMSVGTVGQPRTAPYGGKAPVFGTNPVAFSMPNADGPPITMDYATSAIAAGKISVARAKGEQLPENAVLTREGLPTTDPEEFVRGGFLLPFGGHKGYALAVIAEVMSSALTGADEYSDESPATGAFMFGVSSTAFRSGAGYQHAVSGIVERVGKVPPAEGFDKVLLPGEPEAQSRAVREREGVPVPDRTWDETLAIAADLGVPTDDLLL
jgi:LDH2 family malate/lactate/ureidoglycolate dehydrogenase